MCTLVRNNIVAVRWALRFSTAPIFTLPAQCRAVYLRPSQGPLGLAKLAHLALGGPKIALRGGDGMGARRRRGGGSRNGLPCRALCFV